MKKKKFSQKKYEENWISFLSKSGKLCWKISLITIWVFFLSLIFFSFVLDIFLFINIYPPEFSSSVIIPIAFYLITLMGLLFFAVILATIAFIAKFNNANKLTKIITNGRKRGRNKKDSIKSRKD